MPTPLKRSTTTAAFAGAVLVVLLNTWFAIAAVRSLVHSEYWLAHTWEVINQVERITNCVRDAETATRGYLITGEERYLEPYLRSRREIDSDLQAFADSTSDNAHQRPNIDAARDVIEQRFAMLQGSVDARRNRGYDAARAMVISGNGLAEANRIRQIADNMEAEEYRLLNIREEDARQSGWLAFFAIGLASALDLILIALLFRYFARQRQMRLASEEVATNLVAANLEIARSSAAIQQLNNELEERVQQRTAELETINRELEAFSYSVSHDLRAPLRTIDGFSLALQEDYTDAVDATGRDYIARVRAGVQRMGGLIDALLQLSRITRAELVREDVDATAMAETVAKNLQEENPGQVVHFSIEPGMHANADPHLLQVAFENLMGNAMKFSSRQEESRIEVCFDTAEEAFRVRDNGAGFDMHYSSKLFNAFNRLHGDKDFKGSGIGLATVARVIRRHHGRIWAHSEIGKGATFWFTLG